VTKAVNVIDIDNMHFAGTTENIWKAGKMGLKKTAENSQLGWYKRDVTW